MAVPAIDLLNDLVSIPSPSGDEREAAEYLVGWMQDHGFSANVDSAGNAVGVKGTGQKEVLLLGHIDTFPGEIPVRREGDRLYGRGTVDAKGPLCVFALSALQASIPDDWRVTVVGAVEEENTTSKGARSFLGRRVDQPCQCCIIGEPSGWDRITLGYRGRLVMALDVLAPMAHSAGAQALPAERAVALWGKIRDRCEALSGEAGAGRVFDRIDASLVDITTEREGSYGRVRMTVGFRLPLSMTPDALREHVAALVAEETDGLECDSAFFGEESACRSSKSSPLVRALLPAIRAAGGTPRFVVKAGTSDMNVLAGTWPGIPVVAYGPGDSALDHTPDEALDLQEYRMSIGVFADVLTRLMG